MEDADPGIPDLCHTEHTGTGQPGEQAGKRPGSNSPVIGTKPFEGLFSFFKIFRQGPSQLHPSTGLLSCLIGLDKP
jgi:hypothetical protein